MVDPSEERLAQLEAHVARNTQAIADLTANIRHYRWRVFAAYILICAIFAVGLVAYRLQGNRENEANRKQDAAQVAALAQAQENARLQSCEAENSTRREIIRLASPSPELHTYMENALPLADCTP